MTTQYNSCPNPATLRRYAIGETKEEELHEIAEHLETCSHCLRTLGEFDDVVDPLLAAMRRAKDGNTHSNEDGFRNGMEQVRSIVPQGPIDETSGRNIDGRE